MDARPHRPGALGRIGRGTMHLRSAAALSPDGAAFPERDARRQAGQTCGAAPPPQGALRGQSAPAAARGSNICRAADVEAGRGRAAPAARTLAHGLPPFARVLAASNRSPHAPIARAGEGAEDGTRAWAR